MALWPAGLLDGLENIGTPVMDVTKCILCMECVRVCHTGALKKVPKKEVDIGTAVLDQKICWAWLRKKRCKICVEDCPLKAVELQKNRFPFIIEEKCNGCGICRRRCPTEPKAIEMVYRGEKRHQAPKQRFLVRQPDALGPPEAGVTVPEEPLALRIRELTQPFKQWLQSLRQGKGS
jgi:NAD-dependent dihydropyrimidine dehydrogenase PreA subunit